MLRMVITATFVLLSTSAFSQSNDELRSEKFGAGCIGPISTFAPRLGTCNVAGSMSRIWCPNGKMFQRKASDYEIMPSSYVVRAICDLNQVL
jgi:hypothetical protein